MRMMFDLVECVKGGEVNGHTFKEGELYPVLGANNGIQIAYTAYEEHNGGDCAVLMCHTWDVIAPIEGEQFEHQDGTIPPLFR